MKQKWLQAMKSICLSLAVYTSSDLVQKTTKFLSLTSSNFIVKYFLVGNPYSFLLWQGFITPPSFTCKTILSDFNKFEKVSIKKGILNFPINHEKNINKYLKSL